LPSRQQPSMLSSTSRTSPTSLVPQANHGSLQTFPMIVGLSVAFVLYVLFQSYYNHRQRSRRRELLVDSGRMLEQLEVRQPPLLWSTMSLLACR
jgi:hypothetical protein